MTKFLLNDFIVKEHVKDALKEDIGYGDISTDFLCEENDKLTVYLISREEGIFCGELPFRLVFEILDSKNVKVEFYFHDGDKINKGEKIAKISGKARSILTGERLALNYVQRMSAIATKTNKYAKALIGTNARIADTRKNTPNFRIFEKYSILTGGGSLHRFNLNDCVMLKDNHIALAGGSIKKAVQKIRKNLSHAHKIEVECDTLKQVKDCSKEKIDIIMLDNMNLENMKEAVSYIRQNSPQTIIEASGGIKLENLKDIANCGVDIISTSSLVNASTLDLGFDYIN